MTGEGDGRATAERVWGRVCAYLLIGFGLLFFTVGLVMLGLEYRFGQRAVAAPGTVVDLRVSDSGEGPNYTPVVEFTSREGQKVRFDGQSTSPHPERGDAVPVLYRPADPRDARIDSFLQRWMLPAVFLPIGTLAALAGCYLALTKRAERSAVPA